MTAKEDAVAPLKGNISAQQTAYYGNRTTLPYNCFPPFTSGPPTLPYNWGSQPFMGLCGNIAFHCMYPYGYVHPTLTAAAAQYNSFAILAPSTDLLLAAPRLEADEKSSLGSSAGQSKKSMDMNAANGCENTAKETSATGSGSGGLSFRSEEDGILSLKTANLKPTSAAISANLSGGLDQSIRLTPIQLQKQGSTDSELSFSNSPHGGQGRTNAELWSQVNNKATKRHRRKQSNRDSARRSRLRKQAECEELSMRVDDLIAENTSLQIELDRLSEECVKLFAENAAIMKSLGEENAVVIPMLSGGQEEL